MPVYNGEAYLSESIESIIAQTFTDWELIIINDSSTDNSLAIAEHYRAQDTRITSIPNRGPKGLAGALNSGLAKARGTFIARADADDINVPERLQIEYDYLQTHPTIDIVGSWYKTFGNNKTPKVRKHPQQSVVLAWNYVSNTYFCHPTILFRRKVLETIAHYPLVVCEDFAFLSEVIHTHRGHNIPRVLLNYREHATNYSSTKATAIKESVFETYKNNFAFYGGTVDLTDIFYRFHAHYRLSLKTFFPLIRQSMRIARTILHNYNIQHNLRATVVLYGAIKIHFLKAIANSIVRTLRGK